LKLKAGDTVALISSAACQRGVDAGLNEKALIQLKAWGLHPIDLTNSEPLFYLAGDDESRLASLRQALTDPSIKAIFCTRGGYGSARLGPHFKEITGVSERFLVGYSDITTLHMAAGAFWPKVQRVHGPNIATAQFLDDSSEAIRNRESLRALLFDGNCRVQQSVETVLPGNVTGQVEGGCLSLIVSNLGAGAMPSFDGSIVFLEDVGEAPFRIDRMLTQLRNANYFANAKGIIFGEMTKCSDPYNDLKSVVRDVLKDFNGPIAFGLESGHGADFASVLLGQFAQLDASAGTISWIQ
jgi:muramoyltetrapeptide carboxypeptidase